jgi:hypothetical protein
MEETLETDSKVNTERDGQLEKQSGEIRLTDDGMQIDEMNEQFENA